MTNRTYYLQFSPRNNLVWTRSKKKPTAEPAHKPKFAGQSILDITVADGDKLTLKLGASMPNWKFWMNSKPKYVFGKNTPICIDNTIDDGTRPRRPGEAKMARFIITDGHSKNQIKIKHVDSPKGTKCKFDLHIQNTTSPNLATKLIIDPIIVNDGTGL